MLAAYAATYSPPFTLRQIRIIPNIRQLLSQIGQRQQEVLYQTDRFHNDSDNGFSVHRLTRKHIKLCPIVNTVRMCRHFRMMRCIIPE